MTPSALFVSLLGGGLTGVLLATVISSQLLGIAALAPRGMGIAVGALLLMSVGIFYLGQFTSAIVDGDPGWPRIVSRYLIFVLFSIAAGCGTWAGLARRAR